MESSLFHGRKAFHFAEYAGSVKHETILHHDEQLFSFFVDSLACSRNTTSTLSMRTLNRIKEWVLRKLGIIRLTVQQQEIIDQMEGEYARISHPKDEERKFDKHEHERKH